MTQITVFLYKKRGVNAKKAKVETLARFNPYPMKTVANSARTVPELFESYAGEKIIYFFGDVLSIAPASNTIWPPIMVSRLLVRGKSGSGT